MGVSLSEALKSRNCLSAVRLFLAVVVVFSHAWPLSGRDSEPAIHGWVIGGIAVYGFFAISGFLITRSRDRHPSGARFLWHRFLRIYPPLWFCLCVTAFILAPIAFYHSHHTLVGFSVASGGHYVLADVSGSMRQYAVSGTLRSVPFPGAWDGSLWTLVYELTFYLVLFAVAAVRLLRRSVTALVTLAIMALLILVPDDQLATFNPHNIAALNYAAQFGMCFAAGALLHMFSDRIRMQWWWAAASVAVIWFGLQTLEQPVWLIAIPLAYLLLWTSVALPFVGPSSRHDYSLGVFVYAFPIQQLLVLYGAARWNVWAYFAVTMLVTAPLAVMSRVLVETPADGFKKWSPQSARSRPGRRRLSVARATVPATGLPPHLRPASRFLSNPHPRRSIVLDPYPLSASIVLDDPYPAPPHDVVELFEPQVAVG